jgi:hypothetical protein
MNRLFLLGSIFAFATLAYTQTTSGPIYQMTDLHRLGDQTFARPAYLVGTRSYQTQVKMSEIKKPVRRSLLSHGDAVELIAEVPAHVGDTKPCVYPPGCFFPIDAFEKQAL